MEPQFLEYITAASAILDNAQAEGKPTLADLLDALPQLRPEELEEPQEIRVCPGHTRKVFTPSELRLVAQWAKPLIERLQADAIVASGHSGLLLAGVLSYETGVPVFAVRKKGEQNVATDKEVSGIAPHGKARRWVWVDDLIASGGTLARSASICFNHGLIHTPAPVAVLLYADPGRSTRYDLSLLEASLTRNPWWASRLREAVPCFDWHAGHLSCHRFNYGG